MKTGVVSSASVIVTSPYVHDTQRLLSDNPDRDWGLHVCVVRNGKKPTEKDVMYETKRQVGMFMKRFGFMPTHIDFHKGFKFSNRIYFAVRMFTMANKIAFRYDNMHAVDTGFYGLKNNKATTEDIGIQKLVQSINSLGTGITELVCHPGWTNNRLHDPYRMQRNIEVKTFTSTAIKKAIEQKRIVVINFTAYRSLIHEHRA